MTIMVTIDIYRYRNSLKNKDIENGIAKILNDNFPNINYWEYNDYVSLSSSLETFIISILSAIVEKKNKIYNAKFLYICNNFCLILKESGDG